MSKRVYSLLTAAALGLTATPATGVQTALDNYPVAPEFRPAAVQGPAAVARTVETPDGRRVMARIGNRNTAMLGPASRGDDGAPAMAREADGDLLVVASRRRGATAELWMQRQRASGWQAPRRLRMTGEVNHHPALATSRSATWAVWLRGDGTDRRLHAAAIDGVRLGPEERLPRAGSEAGIPAIGFDAHDQAVVVWSAFDGTDTEVWLSRRSAAGWTTPMPLSNNDVPDEFPSVGRDANGALIVSWSSFTPNGYLPVAVTERGDLDFGVPTPLDQRPAGMTQVLDGSSGVVTWVGIRAEHHELMSAARTGSRWTPASSAGVIGSAKVHTSVAGRRVLTATGIRSYEGTIATGRGASPRIDLGLPAPRPIARNSAPLPVSGTYRGFGDSITEGVIRFDGVVTLSPGYPGPLTEYLAAYFDRPNLTVENNGLGGETTSEGLGRLAQLNAAFPKQVTLIMEGINDATQSVAVATVVANLRAMIRGSQGTDRLAVISTVTPRTSSNFTGGSNPTIRLYNDSIVPMARAEGAFLIDQYAAFFKKAHLYSDLLHPNEQGYTHMAVTWFRGLEPLLIDLLTQQDTSAAESRKGTSTANRADRPIQ